ncbi:L-2-amino-thiazoline-4-carboxylic acid hydrolase [Desulfovibrio inopinatus]|uniref:L-2-amino-thiazoline-4-carboxylic acid hydrolase n=1 Tax=Desulfovibrio inopinatus TaxID=102109 RepID=UPI00040F88C1|nr:L-2-amino-thiazoline-4-carboxylic acid hydrolase [Desulfovibrio inopinatus]
MSEAKLREELYAANENRGILYKFIFDAMVEEFGMEKAKEVMKKGIYKRGQEIGQQFKQYADAGDFPGLRDAFIGHIADDSKMFAPTVTRCDDGGLDIEFDNCPLKNSWRKMGLSDEECATMCEVAGIIDYGTFEGAGFGFEMTALPEGSKEKCYLKIRKK